MAQQLRQAGFEVELPPFKLQRQFFSENAALAIGDDTLRVLPMWWPSKSGTSLRLRTTIAADSNDFATGEIVWLQLPFDRGVYLGERQRNAIAAVVKRQPAAVLLNIDAPSGQEYAYNVAQEDEPWPVPVAIAGSDHTPTILQAQRKRLEVTLTLVGRYEFDVAGRNVVSRLDRGAEPTIVVSAPTTGWFTSACERGAGVAASSGIGALCRCKPAACKVRIRRDCRT